MITFPNIPGKILAAVSLMISSLLCSAEPVETDSRLHADGDGWRLDQAVVGEKKLPKVLLVGDSILSGYQKQVIAELRDRAYVDAWIQPYHQGHLQGTYLTSKIEQVLAHGPYAIVVFNMGLHGYQTGRIPDGQFVPLTKKLVATLRKNAPEAQLVWLSTTPITEQDPRPEYWKLPPPPEPYRLHPEFNPVIIEHNRLAAEVMAGEGVPVIDLYAKVSAHLELARGDMYHWTSPAYAMLAEAIVKDLSARLSTPVASDGGLQTWGRPFTWQGFSGREGRLGEHTCRIVLPPSDSPGRPWIWKPEFLDAFPVADEALVQRGAYLVHLEMPDHYGSPAAVARMNEVHAYLTARFGFASKAGILALSRAGLWAYNWAAENPDHVACIYADNPVCDFKSWPGGKGSGPGCSANWEKCLVAYGFTETEALAYRGNPVDRAVLIARSRIPVLHVVGDADEVVPFAENTARFRSAVRAAGGDYQEIVKPGALHHPHGLDDPAPVVAFFDRHLFAAASSSR